MGFQSGISWWPSRWVGAFNAGQPSKPSKLGCRAEHLLGVRLDTGDLSGSHGVLWAGTHAARTTAFPVLFHGVIFSLIVCGHILDFPQRNCSTYSYVFSASEGAGQFIFESDGSTL